MKKIIKLNLLLILTVFLTACSSPQFDGSRTGNESRLIMDFKILNTTDSQLLKLETGDIVDFKIVSTSGRIDISLQKDDDKPVYEGKDIESSEFDVKINDSGTYKLSVTGVKANGSVSVINAGPESEDSGDSLVDSSFHSLSVKDNDTISSEFEIDLAGNQADFLTIEVTEDMEAAAHYTYTTYDKEGVSWGYYLNGNDDKKTMTLQPKAEDSYNDFMEDEKIILKKGTNVFYISGDGVSCKMRFEVQGTDKTKISYVGAYTKEKAAESLR